MKRVFVVLFLLIAFAYSIASANVTNFEDTTIFWNGYASTDPSDNTRDSIGEPDFYRGTVTTNGSSLTNISFDYWMNGLVNVTPGDLFIDRGADGQWDFVVRMITHVGNPGTYGLYALNGQRFIMSDLAWNRPGNYRNNHPVGTYDLGALVDSVYFSGWEYAVGNHTSYFDFNNFSLIGDTIFSWTPNCANDVIMARVDAVPEPATLLLLCAGLSMFGVFRKKGPVA